MSCCDRGLPREVPTADGKIVYLQFANYWHVMMAAGALDKIDQAYPQGAD